jgi:hypothetical protein
MSNCFEDGQFSKGENRIWRTAKKERWKEVVKHKSIRRDNNHKLQELHINYRLDLSNSSNEAWDENENRRSHKDTDYYTQSKKLKLFIKDLTAYIRR